MTLLSALIRFSHLLAGCSSPGRRNRKAALLETDNRARQATDDRRRRKREGLIRPLPGRQRDELADPSCCAAERLDDPANNQDPGLGNRGQWSRT
jgi:hypothetical protein